MNLTKKTILALGVLAAASVSFAENTPAADAPVGVLGQQFVEAHFGGSDIKNYAKDQYGLGVAANVPVAPYLDVTAGYDYGWIRGVGHFNGVSAGANVYKTFYGVKPFIGGGLGYQWQRWSGGKDDLTNWGLQAGVEIPAGVVTITPKIVYVDDFRDENRSTQNVSYLVEANYWLNKNAGVFGSVGYTEVQHSKYDTWDYTVGFRWKL